MPRTLKKKSKPRQQKNPWARAKEYTVIRSSPCGLYNEEIDRGVNFFVLMLEQLGAVTEYSCEGHPGGFYVLFSAPYAFARRVAACGFFHVEIEGKNRWSIRTNFKNEEEKSIVLSYAAENWEDEFGPLTNNPGRRNRRRTGTKR